MLPIKKVEQGVTLLEMILVIAIGAMIFLFSYRQYVAFRRDADIAQLRTNVDILFQAAASYFKGHCAPPEGTQSNVFSVLYPAGSMPITMTALKNGGYLNQDLPTSPYVDYSSPAPDGYIVQFNQDVTSGGTLPSRTVNMSSGGVASVGSVVLWNIQISVNLKSGYSSLSGPLGANCLSNMAGNHVATCANAPANATQFAVFQRLSSYTSSQQQSIMWYSTPLAKQFRQMYTTDPILILVDPSQTNQLNNQYYVCN